MVNGEEKGEKMVVHGIHIIHCVQVASTDLSSRRSGDRRVYKSTIVMLSRALLLTSQRYTEGYMVSLASVREEGIRIAQ